MIVDKKQSDKQQPKPETLRESVDKRSEDNRIVDTVKPPRRPDNDRDKKDDSR